MVTCHHDQWMGSKLARLPGASIRGVAGSDTTSDGCAASHIPACNEHPRDPQDGRPGCLGSCLPSPNPPISIYLALIFPLMSPLAASLSLCKMLLP